MCAERWNIADWACHRSLSLSLSLLFYMEVAGCFYIRVAGEVLSSSLLHMYIADKEVDVYAAISYIFPCAYIRKHYSKPIYFIWMELAQRVGGKASHRNGSDKISVDPCPCISLILRINASNFVREEYI